MQISESVPCRLSGYLIPWNQDNSSANAAVLSSFYSSSADQEIRVPGVLVRRLFWQYPVHSMRGPVTEQGRTPKCCMRAWA
jgi:hypothetical protein